MVWERVARATLVLAGLVGTTIFGLWLVGAPVPWHVDPCEDPSAEIKMVSPHVPLWAAQTAMGMVNAIALLAFGVVHSTLARPEVKEPGVRLLGGNESLYRALYVCVSGVHLFIVTMYWRPVCGALWELPLGALEPHRWAMDLPLLAAGFSGVLYSASLHADVNWLGLGPRGGLHSGPSQRKELVQTGLYGVVRHPMYMFTMLGFVATTRMSIDRLSVIVGVLFYLYGFGLSLEEASLIEEFGHAYRQYRERVPAVIPGPIEGLCWWLLGDWSPGAIAGIGDDPAPHLNAKGKPLSTDASAAAGGDDPTQTDARTVPVTGEPSTTKRRAAKRQSD
jgi:methanethiol S-methyltransferase